MDKVLTPKVPLNTENCIHYNSGNERGYDYIYRYVDDSAGLVADPMTYPKEVVVVVVSYYARARVAYRVYPGVPGEAAQLPLARLSYPLRGSPGPLSATLP